MFSSLFGGDARSAEPADEEATSTSSTGFLSGLTDFGKKLQKGVESMTDKAFSDFNKEQEAFVRSKHKGTDAAVPPWVGAANEDELKSHILKLSADERNFVRDPPPGARTFQFNFETAYPVAVATMPFDDQLEVRRFELVPKRLSEEHFWRNYFYRVSLIKQSFGVNAVASEALQPLDSALLLRYALSHVSMDGLDNHVQATADSGLSPVEAAIVAPEDAPLPTEPSELDHVKEYEHDFEDEAEVPVEDADFELSELDGGAASEHSQPSSREDDSKLSSEEDAILVDTPRDIAQEMQGEAAQWEADLQAELDELELEDALGADENLDDELDLEAELESMLEG